MENECGNCGVWKMRTMKNEKWGKCGVFIIHMYMFFFFYILCKSWHSNLPLKELKNPHFPHSLFSIGSSFSLLRTPHFPYNPIGLRLDSVFDVVWTVSENAPKSGRFQTKTHSYGRACGKPNDNDGSWWWLRKNSFHFTGSFRSFWERFF